MFSMDLHLSCIAEKVVNSTEETLSKTDYSCILSPNKGRRLLYRASLEGRFCRKNLRVKVITTVSTPLVYKRGAFGKHNVCLLSLKGAMNSLGYRRSRILETSRQIGVKASAIETMTHFVPYSIHGHLTQGHSIALSASSPDYFLVPPNRITSDSSPTIQ